MRVLLATAVISILPLGLAAAECDFPAEVCEVQAAFDRADELLGETLKSILEKTENDGFSDYLVEADEITESLKTAQLAWMKYSYAHCAAAFRLMSGGTSRQEDELSCLAGLAEARTEQLRELYCNGYDGDLTCPG